MYIERLELELSGSETPEAAPAEQGVVFNHIPGEMKALGFKERYLN